MGICPCNPSITSKSMLTNWYTVALDNNILSFYLYCEPFPTWSPFSISEQDFFHILMRFINHKGSCMDFYVLFVQMCPVVKPFECVKTNVFTVFFKFNIIFKPFSKKRRNSTGMDRPSSGRCSKSDIFCRKKVSGNLQWKRWSHGLSGQLVSVLVCKSFIITFGTAVSGNYTVVWKVMALLRFLTEEFSQNC